MRQVFVRTIGSTRRASLDEETYRIGEILYAAKQEFARRLLRQQRHGRELEAEGTCLLLEATRKLARELEEAEEKEYQRAVAAE